jgi:hypothetical protein
LERTTLRCRDRGDRRSECRAKRAKAGGTRSPPRRRRRLPGGDKRRDAPRSARPRALRALRRPPRRDRRPPTRRLPEAAPCPSLQCGRDGKREGKDGRPAPRPERARALETGLSVAARPVARKRSTSTEWGVKTRVPPANPSLSARGSNNLGITNLTSAPTCIRPASLIRSSAVVKRCRYLRHGSSRSSRQASNGHDDRARGRRLTRSLRVGPGRVHSLAPVDLEGASRSYTPSEDATDLG